MDAAIEKSLARLAKEFARSVKDEDQVLGVVGKVIRKRFRKSASVSLDEVLVDLQRLIDRSRSVRGLQRPDLDIDRMMAEAAIKILKPLKEAQDQS